MKIRPFYLSLAVGFLGLPLVLWGLTSHQPASFSDALEKRSGVFTGHRRAHSKGICGQGRFISNGNGSEITTALFAQENSISPVIFRFSTGGSNPYAPDNRRVFRSMALLLQQSDGHQWRTAMNHVPVFILKNPADFPLLHLAHVPDPKTGKPDPQKVKAFFDARPETKAMRHWMKNGPLPSRFTRSKFYGINSFIFENSAEQESIVRWEFVPEDGEDSLTPQGLKELTADELFEKLRSNFTLKNSVKTSKKWQLIVQFSEPEDDITDPTVKWPDSRRRLSLGTLELYSISEQTGSSCEAIVFDPLILPPGIKPSSDPLLIARSAAYNISLERRLSEGYPLFKPHQNLTKTNPKEDSQND